MQQLQYIVIGDPQSPSFTFEGDDILSTSGDFSVDMIGAELSTDVMEVEVSYDDTDGTLRSLPWATPICFYRGERQEGRLYSVSVTRIGRKAYRIRATSAAGIMEYEKFYGGMYAGEAFQTVIECIVGTNGLQPFDGVYNRYIRKKDATTTKIFGPDMGMYPTASRQGQGSVGNGPFLSATMSSKLSAKIKILGFTNEAISSTGTSWRCSLLGAIALSTETEVLIKHRYGLYMLMTRASASDPYPAFGEVFFVYGQTEISLGTPVSADEAVYELEVDPGAGTAIINGVTYTITLDNSVADDACALHIYGGGANLLGLTSDIFASFDNHNCEHEVFYYMVRSSDGDLQADYTAVRNMCTGKIGVYDYVTHTLRQAIQNSAVLTSDLVPYDASTYGEYPLFNNRTDFQADVLSRLTYADGIDSIPIYGWLPICKKREALQQLLFATGVILIKDEDGTILFTAPSSRSAGTIHDDDVYDEGSEDQPDHINTVELTEHAYVLNMASDPESIYENDAGAPSEYYIASFSNAPAEQVGSSGLTCLYANCNAALVTGTGILTGRFYAHMKTVLRREIASFPDGHGINVPDASLVTLLNGENVMDRLVAYYSAARKTRVDIAMDGERCGLKYDLTSAFDEAFSGFLVHVNKVITSIVRGACEFVLGYTPPQIGGAYANYVILTGSGTWTVPASVFEKETPRIHVVLIGGGQGGDGGFAGADGMKPARGGSSLPAEGGMSGDSGSGGKIFEVTITNPVASYTYSCGQGGAGGGISNSHSSNNPGNDGGDTVFAELGHLYSSAHGATSEIGIANRITGKVYAKQMVHTWKNDGTSQFNGGKGGYLTDDQQEAWLSWYGGETCDGRIMNMNYHGWVGGSIGTNYKKNNLIWASGGCGGGGGYGQAGSDGSAGSYSSSKYRGGNGGKGGDAINTPPKATDYNPDFYGYGGLGGGGGGGGGAGGWATDTASSVTGTGGAGGYGGRGGDGGDGCVLIYY